MRGLPAGLAATTTSDGVRLTFEQNLGHGRVGQLVVVLAALYASGATVAAVLDGEMPLIAGVGLAAMCITFGPWVWRRATRLFQPSQALSRREVLLSDTGIAINGERASWQSLARCEVGYASDGAARIELEFDDGRVVHLWGHHVYVGDLDELVIFMHELRAAATVERAEAAAVRAGAARLLDR